MEHGGRLGDQTTGSGLPRMDGATPAATPGLADRDSTKRGRSILPRWLG
jgi:hypothetical protein